jgi:hypothetical protein
VLWPASFVVKRTKEDFARLAEEQPGYVGIMENATRNHHRIARDATAFTTQ